jgi:hypothetical protein
MGDGGNSTQEMVFGKRKKYRLKIEANRPQILF